MSLFLIHIEHFTRARGAEPALAFAGNSPQALAEAIEDALQRPTLFERWRTLQTEPDKVPAALAAVDAGAGVRATQRDLHVELEIRSGLPMKIIAQRLTWLIGPHWDLRNVK